MPPSVEVAYAVAKQDIMQPALQLLNKLSQLCAPHRRDIAALVETLAGAPNGGARVFPVLPRRFNPDYLQRWSDASGGEIKEIARFLRGGAPHLLLPKVSLANLHISGHCLIFSVLFLTDFDMEGFVGSDMIETLYLLHGSLELILRDQHNCVRLRVSAGEVSQIAPGTPYQLFAHSGTLAVSIHSTAKADPQTGASLELRHTAKVRLATELSENKPDESRGSGAA
ncbi:MAG: hypothetical protein HY315_08895 [Acidobacteria bacterium]|nr:hypothetical protein [Acidobacteriota bacterium]